MNGSLLSLAISSLRSRWVSATLTLFAIAISVTLFLGVDQLRKGARSSFESTLSGTDLLVGARSSDVNLLLYAVFRMGSATNDISWETYQAISKREDIAWTIPIALGDSVAGFRVVGTDGNYFEHYRYGARQSLAFADGVPFDDMFDAVLGATAAQELGLTVGDALELSHGVGETSLHDHDDKPFHVSGILKPTQTPVDRSVHISLAGMEAIHLGWHGGAASPLAKKLTPDTVRGLQLEPDELTAFLVGMKSRGRTLTLLRDVNAFPGEALTAVIPGVALTQLWQVVGSVETALQVIAGFVVLTGLIGLLTSILTSLNERRREMALLRAVGARPHHVFALLVLEAAVLAAAGCVLGCAFVYAGLALAGPILQDQFGLLINVGLPGLSELGLLGVVILLAILLSMVPAWLAYRRSLGDGLSLQI